MARRGGSGGMEILLIMFVCLVSSFFSLIGGYLFFKQEPGDPCTGDDDNAEYQIDDDGKCTFLSCKTGYELENSNCVVYSPPAAGDLCDGGVIGVQFVLDENLECVVSGCKPGYTQDESVTESVICKEDPTPDVTHCVGSWSEYGDCSESCGGGTKTKTYSVTTPAGPGGNACPYTDGATETEPCNIGECPVDCEGYYGEWEDCDTVSGTKKQRYNVTRVPNSTGEQCPPINIEKC